jgi:hypothetical protein
MSYTKIEVNGQEVGLKFGYEAVKDFLIHCEENKDDYFDKNNILTVFGVADLVYCAYKNNQLIKDEAVTIPIEDFEDWVLEMAATDKGTEELTKIGKMYEDSKYVKLFLRQASRLTEDIKKKTSQPTLKKSKQSSLVKG